MATARRDPNAAKRGTGRKPKRAATVVQAAPLVVLDSVRPVLPEPPVPLPDNVRPLWDAIMGDLADRGLRASDYELLHALCMAAHRRREAAALVSLHGLVLIGATGQAVANPALRIERDNAQLVARLAQEFGLSLASRMRLGLIELAGMSTLQSISAALDRA